MTTLKDDLVGILDQASQGHAFAFMQVDGQDDDWAYWYAAYMQQALSKAVGQSLTRSRIVQCLLQVEEERLVRFGADHPWQQMYAEHFINAFAPAAASETLALYYYPECPYCQRVLRAIEQTATQVELRHIWDHQGYRAELQAARGRTTVPVLRITGNGQDRWLPESADIVRYLQERVGT